MGPHIRSLVVHRQVTAKPIPPATVPEQKWPWHLCLQEAEKKHKLASTHYLDSSHRLEHPRAHELDALEHFVSVWVRAVEIEALSGTDILEKDWFKYQGRGQGHRVKQQEVKKNHEQPMTVYMRASVFWGAMAARCAEWTHRQLSAKGFDWLNKRRIELEGSPQLYDGHPLYLA